MTLKLIEYSNDMDDTYRSIEENNPNKRRKILVVFDMIADMLSNKKFSPIVAELFRKRDRKLNIYFAFITQSYFVVPKKY